LAPLTASTLQLVSSVSMREHSHRFIQGRSVLLPSPVEHHIQPNSSAYLKLQFGCEPSPDLVSCRCSLPSASIVQICNLPVRFDWNTICRPSGDHEGKSFLPPSCVSWAHCLLATSIT